MPSAYIQMDELDDFDLPAATTEGQIRAASVLVDAYLKRPEGLAWSPDYNGDPCYMSGLVPRLTKKSAGALAPGQSVSIDFTAGAGVVNIVGYTNQAVILDRGNTAAVEACVVQSVQPNGIILANVTQSHNAGCTIDFGLTIEAQRRLPAKRSLTQLGSWPVVRLISGAGSYRYGRRSEQQAGLYADQSVLAMMQTF